MLDELIIIGAYGRKYHSKAAILKDWNANLDFRVISTGQYTNKTDATRYDKAIRFRWGKQLQHTAPLRYLEGEDE